MKWKAFLSGFKSPIMQAGRPNWEHPHGSQRVYFFKVPFRFSDVLVSLLPFLTNSWFYFPKLVAIRGFHCLPIFLFWLSIFRSVSCLFRLSCLLLKFLFFFLIWSHLTSLISFFPTLFLFFRVFFVSLFSVGPTICVHLMFTPFSIPLDSNFAFESFFVSPFLSLSSSLTLHHYLFISLHFSSKNLSHNSLKL